MSITSLLKCLTLMNLSLAMKDIAKLSGAYAMWERDAADVLRKHGALRAFTTVSNSFKKSKFECTEGHAEDMSAALKPHLPAFVADTSITHEQLALLKDLLLFMRKDSAAAWGRISKNVSILGDHQLSALFLEEDQKGPADLSVVQGMERIVLALTKRKNDAILTVNEVRDFATTQPKLMAKYVALRKEFKANYVANLRKFVRLSGKSTIDVERARAYLKAVGCNYLPVGFVGKVDEHGKLYTSADKALKGTMFGTMKMNPAYNAKTDDTYYAKLVGDMRGELRTLDFLKRSKTARIGKVGDFSDNLETYRSKWLKDLNSADDAVQMIAAIVEAVHLTQARVGGEKNKNDGIQTFGISTLRARHMRVTTQGLEMRYPGKKGTLQHHIIKPSTPTNRKVIAIFKAALKDKEKGDLIFVSGGLPIKPREINNYLRSIGADVTIHKFRHSAADRTAKAMLAKSPFNSKNVPTQAQAERWIKTEAIKIGELLHHRTGSGDKQKVTSTTAIAAYISPNLIKKFFTDLGLRVPKWLPAFEDDE